MSDISKHRQPRHPIRVVAARTGLSLDVLRVWERRYAAVRPTRTDGRQRLYSDEDIERLGLLKRATEAGRSISQVAALSAEELARLVAGDAAASPKRRSGERTADDAAPAAAYLARALAAVEGLDPAALDAALRQATFAFGARTLIAKVLVPLLEQIGSRWRAGDLTPAHEHAASVVIRRLIDQVALDGESDRLAPTVVVATPAEEHHEFGAMLAGASARQAGWRVVYLGRDLPVEHIAGAARRMRAECVALSLVYPAAAAAFLAGLPVLYRLLGDVPIVVGGAAAARLRSELESAGARVMLDLRAFTAALELLKGGSAGDGPTAVAVGG